MEYTLILTKVVYSHGNRRTCKYNRYHRTLAGAMREGTRLLHRNIAIKVEVFCPVANRVIKRRLPGANWTTLEEDHVSPVEKADYSV